ncbi:MAG: (2Fe-2S)-binding protein [Fimbriimonadaceae bacterium]
MAHPPKEVVISVNGRRMAVAAGTSVLAALWNAGMVPVRRSVDGEPRAGLCGMGTCFDCLVTVDGVANERACRTTCREGMMIKLDA